MHLPRSAARFATSASMSSGASSSIGSSETLTSSHDMLHSTRRPDSLGQIRYGVCQEKRSRASSVDPAFLERLGELSPEGVRIFLESLAAQENAQLRRQVDLLEKQNQALENHAQGLADEVASLSAHLLTLESQAPIVQAFLVTTDQAKSSISSTVRTVPVAQAQRCTPKVDGGCLEELVMIRGQLEAAQTLKDVLHVENVTLQERVVQVEQELRDLQKQQLLSNHSCQPKVGLETGDQFASCVVCLERAPTVVCMPCKHLALCSQCCDEESLTCCPICRCDIEGKIDVFLP